MTTDLAFVAAYFNPCQYRRLRDNLARFSAQFASERLLVVECAYFGRPFEIEGALQVRSNSVVFQKERLFNLAAKQLIDEGYRKIVFCDADIVFTSPDWQAALSQSLDQSLVVQGFSKALMRFEGTIKPGWSAMRYFLEISRGVMTMHRGLCWGVRSEVLDQCELYDRCLVGSGDSALCLGTFKGTAKAQDWQKMLTKASFAANDRLRDNYVDWSDRWSRVVGTSIGYAKVLLESLPHGTIHNRKYVERYALMQGIDPDDVIAEPGKPLEWCCNKPDAINAVRQYFLDRQEDEEVPYEPPPNVGNFC